jgi:hypothetical protein
VEHLFEPVGPGAPRENAAGEHGVAHEAGITRLTRSQFGKTSAPPASRTSGSIVMVYGSARRHRSRRAPGAAPARARCPSGKPRARARRGPRRRGPGGGAGRPAARAALGRDPVREGEQLHGPRGDEDGGDAPGPAGSTCRPILSSSGAPRDSAGSGPASEPARQVPRICPSATPASGRPCPEAARVSRSLPGGFPAGHLQTSWP